MSPSHPERVRRNYAPAGRALTRATKSAMISNNPKSEDKMLRRGKDSILHTYGYLVSVELAEGGNTSSEKVASRLADACAYMEDVGAIDVDPLGQVETYDPSVIEEDTEAEKE